MSRWLCRTVEQTRSIDIGTVGRAGFVGKPAHNWWVARDRLWDLNVRPTRWRDGLIKLPYQTLDTTQIPSRFGGQRYYFRCNCGRRVEKLHSWRARPWRCRHCCDLTYATRQATARFRHQIKAQKISERLGGNSYFELPPKPRGMHWKRYEQFWFAHEEARDTFVAMSATYILRLGRKLSRRV